MKTPMKTIVLLDPHAGGHHLMYLRLFSQILLDLGCRVVAFGPEPENLTDWVLVHSENSEARFRAIALREQPALRLPGIGQLPQPLTVMARWQQARAAREQVIRELGWDVDLVCLNWIDTYLSYYISGAMVDAIFPFPWFGLCFLPRLPFAGLPVKQQGWFGFHEAMNARHCQGVGVFDEGHAIALHHLVKKPILTFPDITDDSPPDLTFPLVKKLRDYAQGRKIIGLIGSLNKRKGLLTLLKAAQQSLDQNWCFAFIGQLSIYTLSAEEQNYIQALAQSPPANCFFHLERIPDEPQFNALIQTCDLLFAAYENFPYSSNLLTKAAVFEKPIIVSQGFCMAERVKKFKLGMAIAPGSVEQCIDAIQKLAQQQEQPEFQPNFAGYRQKNSVEQMRVMLEQVVAMI